MTWKNPRNKNTLLAIPIHTSIYICMYLSIYTYIYSIGKLFSHKLLGFSHIFFKTPILPSVFGYISGAYIRNIKFSHWFHFFVSCNNNASHIHIWCQGHMLLNKKHYMWVITYGTICGYELHLLCYQTCGYDINTILYNLHQCINHVLLIK